VKVRALTAPKQFYSVNGERSREIRVDAAASDAVIFGYGAREGAVRVGR
jgi:propanediol dehydratase large subunit